MPNAQPGRPPVSPERLVRSALDLVDEQGVDALTLRSLATRTSSGTATLYRHFHGRDDLARRVVDMVLNEIELDEELLGIATWDRAVAHIARALFAVLARHHRVAPLVLERAPAGPAALRLRERFLAVVLDGGFTPSDAVRTYATIARFVLGFAVQLHTKESDSDSGGHGPDSTDPAAWPASSRVASIEPIPLTEEFEYGLALLIAGLRAERR